MCFLLHMLNGLKSVLGHSRYCETKVYHELLIVSVNNKAID